MAEDPKAPGGGARPEQAPGPERPGRPERAERPGRPDRDERGRARAYLDLWERRLVELALDGPGLAARRPPPR
jgi:hypothetical protein